METPTEYTQRIAGAAGLGIVDLDAERKERRSNVVQFRRDTPVDVA